jgi:hypothetical protein
MTAEILIPETVKDLKTLKSKIIKPYYRIRLMEIS